MCGLIPDCPLEVLRYFCKIFFAELSEVEFLRWTQHQYLLKAPLSILIFKILLINFREREREGERERHLCC